MSETGIYKEDEDSDMAVLYKRAKDAVRYFNDWTVREKMEDANIFGFPFSVIENGKLADTDVPRYNSNYIQRTLSFGRGVWKGITMTYSDMRWGKDTGGSCCGLLEDIYDISIDCDRLHIRGYLNDEPREYTYRIQRNEGAIVKNLNSGALDRWLT